MSSSRHRTFIVALAILVASVCEGTAYLAGRFLAGRGVFYVPQDDVSGFADYAAKRHPTLGWPSPGSFGKGLMDASGSRVIPAYSTPGNACVSLYGDSFTFGDGVSNDEAWSNLLSQRLGCRVANYGVSGYGSDQALLRFEGNHDEAPVVVLAHLSENIMRNVNQLRDLLYAGTRWGLKPRFALSRDGGLVLVPLPAPSAAEYATLVARPERYLDHEYFLPGGPAGIGRLRFPYTLSLLGALRNFHVRSELRRRPWYAEFYDPAHDSQALEVTARIIERFERVARSRGKLPVPVLIPTGLDLQYHARAGEWIYQSLVTRLHSAGSEIVDLGPPLAEELQGRDPCEVFLSCDGHYNAEGNALLAEVMERVIQRTSGAGAPPARSGQ